jgi:hypothetical protein
VLSQLPDADQDGGDQPAIEHAARTQQGGELLPTAGEVLEVDNEQQRLGADKRADDHPDAEVHDPRVIEARCLGAPDGHPQAEQIGGGEQHAVGINGERSRVKQDWMHWS